MIGWDRKQAELILKKVIASKEVVNFVDPCSSINMEGLEFL